MPKSKTDKYILNIPVDVGEGPQTIVYLHGINGNGQSITKVVDRLKMSGRRVIAPDMLGYGLSPKPLNINYTIDDHVDAHHNTLTKLKLKKPFILIGYSMGGVIAPRYASRYPEEVEKLVLISAPFYLKPGDMTGSRYVKSIFTTDAWKKIWDWSRRLNTRHRRMFRYLSSENVKFIQGAINATDLEVDWPIFQKCIHNTIEKSTLGADLKKIKCPTTFVVGKKDAIVVTDQLDALKYFKPDLEIRRIATIKADHFVLDKLPGQIAAEIERAIDIKLHVSEDRGQGEVIVFLHGIEGSADYWHDYVLCLGDRHRVITLDLLGFGRSSKPLNIAYTIDDQVKYLLATFEQLGVRRATLVGHSLGSLVALGLAARHPERVKKLIMFEPVIISTGQKLRAKNLNQLKDSTLDRIDVFRQKINVLMQKRAVKDVLGEENLQNYVPTLRSIENVIEKQTVSADLAKTAQISTVMVYGSRDGLVSEENILRQTKRHKQVTAVKVKAGHNAPLQRPIECLKLIDDKIDENAIRSQFGKKRSRGKAEIDKTLRKNTLLLLFRGLVNLIFGLALIFGNYPARYLVIGVVVYVFISSATILTQSISLRGERFNWLMSAAMGLIGLGLGIYLMLEPHLSLDILFTVAGLYILVYGIMYILVGVMVKDGQRPTWQMYGMGLLYVIISILLLAQSKLGITLVVLALAVTAAASGALLIGYSLLTYLLSRHSIVRARFS